jgi:hypothetical protein
VKPVEVKSNRRRFRHTSGEIGHTCR